MQFRYREVGNYVDDVKINFRIRIFEKILSFVKLATLYPLVTCRYFYSTGSIFSLECLHRPIETCRHIEKKACSLPQ